LNHKSLENEVFKQNKERLELDSNNRLNNVELKNLTQENIDLEYNILSNHKIQEMAEHNFEITERNIEKVTKDKFKEYEDINQRIVSIILSYFKI